MLRSSYVAIEQFQSQKKSIDSFRALKELLESLDLSLAIQVESPTIWKMEWDFIEGYISGVMELGVQPILMKGPEEFQARYPTMFRLEQPKPIGMDVLEFRLLELLKRALDASRIQS